MTLKVGDAAWIFSFGTWYPGTVTKTTAVRVYVTYTTGSGVTRTKAYRHEDRRISATPRTGHNLEVIA